MAEGKEVSERPGLARLDNSWRSEWIVSCYFCMAIEFALGKALGK